MAENCIMTVEEYLGQYLKIEDEIQSEKEYIASLKAIVENTTTHLSFTAGRNPSSKTRCSILWRLKNVRKRK